MAMAVRNASSAGAGIRRIALEQDFAADAMALRVKPTLSSTLGLGDDAVDGRVRGFDFAGFRFGLGQRGRNSGTLRPIPCLRQAAIAARMPAKPTSWSTDGTRDHDPKKAP